MALTRIIHEARLTFLMNGPISLRLNAMRTARQSSCIAFTLSLRHYSPKRLEGPSTAQGGSFTRKISQPRE